ncbi:GNAT family N-acetyltransferase [Xenophilus arseniciresistens]|uniref:GNAT family N-acetyltransferase n=1 Tax=Xenophilus arseniciresistens TaxID=1283306 RepID=A0AAE3N5C1_9BURK|nr:GNAT family N-acetyltransferase [Xenophilus arseniciresistens]MDA7415840.1 GNAT family N-acetyltransferase [Xenophilus arseniciresistens]
MSDATSEGAVLRLHTDPAELDATAWDALLERQSLPTPFMRHAYLSALHASGSATAGTGWAAAFATLHEDGVLSAACPLYVKNHSYGEYVFDWAWANAYEEHGLAYYPKAVVAVPFTPVPGSRLLAQDAASRARLVQGLLQWCGQMELSSLHLLFGSDEDMAACEQAGLMRRQTVQFHWSNVAPTLPASRGSLPPEGALAALGRPGGGSVPWPDFDAFLASLSQEKRKKIRQERRKVADAGVSFRWARGADIADEDWDFFYRCYARTYREHGNPPYLTREFFRLQARSQPESWLLFVAERGGQPMACSLIALGADADGTPVAYGRYWGALERVDCLHFEACYYQPLQWCIAQGYGRFEGGAQGEHKMARALMPVATHSAHWLAHPGFADAVDRFLAREDAGIAHYLDELATRNPFRRGAPAASSDG